MKWIPAPLILVLPPRTRGWGLVFLALSILLSVVMLPLTIVQFQALFGFGERPVRADYLVFIWSAVPWWWRLRHPFAFLSAAAWAAAWRVQRDRGLRWWRAFRLEPRPTLRAARSAARSALRRFVGLDGPSVARRERRGTAGGHVVADVGD
jgi:hypothetical protein